MKRQIVMEVLAVALVSAALVATATFAQDGGPSKAVTPDTQAVKAADVPQVPAQDRQAIERLQVQAFGYAQSIAVLQEKLDASNAEFARMVQRLQAAQPGYELTQGLTYVKKPDAKKDTEKKEPPK